MEELRCCNGVRPPPPLPKEACFFSSGIQHMIDANDSELRRILLETKAPSPVPVKPTADIEGFVRWIHRHTPDCEPATYVVAYIYVRRFLEWKEAKGELLFLTSYNFQPVVLVSILVAAKDLSQSAYSNSHYALVGGTSTRMLNDIELEFVFALDFDLHVGAEQFRSFCAYLERIDWEMSLKKKKKNPADHGDTKLSRSTEAGSRDCGTPEEQLLISHRESRSLRQC